MTNTGATQGICECYISRKLMFRLKGTVKKGGVWTADILQAGNRRIVLLSYEHVLPFKKME